MMGADSLSSKDPALSAPWDRYIYLTSRFKIKPSTSYFFLSESAFTPRTAKSVSFIQKKEKERERKKREKEREKEKKKNVARC